MKRKSNLRRVIAFLLSAVLMLSTYIPAFAEESEADAPATSAACAETEGCGLENGHEGDCAVPPAATGVPASAAEPETSEPDGGTPETMAQPPAEEETAPEESSAPAEDGEAEQAYTLHLTHYFRFTINGEGRTVRAEETLTLTEADFADGVCDLSRFAYDAEQLTVTEADPLSQESFDETHEGGARIVYAVAGGWKLVPVGEAGSEGTVLREVFQGSLSDYDFVPADLVRVNVEYKYSSTGGLAGVDAASPAIIEALPERQDDGTYAFEFALPTVDGFRIVLDPEPLNEYLVQKPTGNETTEELQEMLQNGSFSVDVAHNWVYAYQEKANDLLAEPDDTVLNATYHNRYSTQDNGAWNRARETTVLDEEGNAAAAAMAISGTQQENGVGNHGANALEDPKLRVILTEAQLQKALEQGLSLTVHYRRNATWYTVNHWVPQEFADRNNADQTNAPTKTESGKTYVLLTTERMEGRVGALTGAAAKTGGVYDLLVSLPFSQKLIRNGAADADGTTVDIYYKAAESYRVIFNTDYTYIPRQQVALDGTVDFTDMRDPTRKGYEFAGWQYLRKDAELNDNGEYTAEDYESITDENGQSALTVDADLITRKAKLQETDGVPVLHLYPIWEPAQTQVTVILWTEDLTGVDDVQAVAEGGNSAYYNGKYEEYQAAPVTHPPVPQSGNSNYSNVGSFTMEVPTDSSLIAEGDSTKLLDTIQTAIGTNFAASARGTTGIDPSPFYTQHSFEIMHEAGGEMDYTTTTANADGKTMIYVYFTRNIYTLRFHYYGTATVGGVTSDYCVATNTNGFSYAGVENIIQDGELQFYYTATHEGGGRSHHNTYIRPTELTGDEQMPVPKTITITAKYGADLRDVWPAARPEEYIDRTNEGKGEMISWATTQGKYRDDAKAVGTTHSDEPTIMGLYATMDAEIIAVPNDPAAVHHLVAYWYPYAISYYRYNHCFEVPGLRIESEGVETISLYNNSTDLKDTLYLVPTDNPAITKYGFTDLMEVSYDAESGEVTYDVKDGGYYAVRGYAVDGVTRYYAVGRRLDTVSTNAIEKQNPSARLHMTRVNSNADHTAQWQDGHGRTWTKGDDPGTPVGTKDAPYDLYFYYDRDRYTITYLAPQTHSADGKSEVELGHIELPYGAHVTENAYSFRLDYRDTNQSKDGNDAYKYFWSWPTNSQGQLLDAVPVCPDRNENGTAEWTFRGWGLGPAGVNMQWLMPDEYTPQAQAESDFYIDSDLRLYAIWEAPTLTVTFHLNGGHVSSRERIEVPVPANTVYTTAGTIPRPVRNGYTLTGWYLSDENGNPIEPQKDFDFDSVIIEDVHVAAVWTAATDQRYSCNIYHVTPALSADDQDKHFETVRIDADGSIVASGGTEYYVLAKEERPGEVYIPSIVLNLTAKLLNGYIPRVTNQSLAVTEADKSYDAVFIYDPQTTGSHTVNFVEAGTEMGSSPQVVYTLRVEADQTVATPGAAAVTALTGNGYQLVNREADGTYTAVTDYKDLTWLDQSGDPQPVGTLAGDAIPDTVTYLVRPIPYTIAYENAAGSPAAAKDALSAVTAAANTPVSGAGDKNPTQYTQQDETFCLRNPDPVSEGGKLYRFSHWSLSPGTTEVPAPGTDTTYPTLEVSKGTAGNLTFVANWETVPAGALTVTKTVEGEPGDLNQEFSFTVALDDAGINGIYGDMTFTDGVAAFTLRHGESKTASGLPAGVAYTVTEQANPDYVATSDGDTGIIQAGETASAAFINTRREGEPPTEPDTPQEPGGETPTEPDTPPKPGGETPTTPDTPPKPGGETPTTPDTPQQTSGSPAKGTSTSPSSSPQTGDSSNPVLWIALLALGVAGLTGILAARKKNRPSDQDGQAE